jgi:hypothetical protein
MLITLPTPLTTTKIYAFFIYFSPNIISVPTNIIKVSNIFFYLLFSYTAQTLNI